jgi:hypothetical protein
MMILISCVELVELSVGKPRAPTQSDSFNDGLVHQSWTDAHSTHTFLAQPMSQHTHLHIQRSSCVLYPRSNVPTTGERRALVLIVHRCEYCYQRSSSFSKAIARDIELSQVADGTTFTISFFLVCPVRPFSHHSLSTIEHPKRPFPVRQMLLQIQIHPTSLRVQLWNSFFSTFELWVDGNLSHLCPRIFFSAYPLWLEWGKVSLHHALLTKAHPKKTYLALEM